MLRKSSNLSIYLAVWSLCFQLMSGIAHGEEHTSDEAPQIRLNLKPDDIWTILPKAVKQRILEETNSGQETFTEKDAKDVSEQLSNDTTDRESVQNKIQAFQQALALKGAEPIQIQELKALAESFEADNKTTAKPGEKTADASPDKDAPDSDAQKGLKEQQDALAEQAKKENEALRQREAALNQFGQAVQQQAIQQQQRQQQQNQNEQGRPPSGAGNGGGGGSSRGSKGDSNASDDSNSGNKDNLQALKNGLEQNRNNAPQSNGLSASLNNLVNQLSNNKNEDQNNANSNASRGVRGNTPKPIGSTSSTSTKKVASNDADPSVLDQLSNSVPFASGPGGRRLVLSGQASSGQRIQSGDGSGNFPGAGAGIAANSSAGLGSSPMVGGSGSQGGYGQGGGPSYVGGGDPFNAVGAEEPFYNAKYNYLKFGNGDYVAAGASSEGGQGSEGEGGGSKGKSKSIVPYSAQIMESGINPLTGARGLMSFVGRVLKMRCDKNPSSETLIPEICRKDQASSQSKIN